MTQSIPDTTTYEYNQPLKRYKGKSYFITIDKYPNPTEVRYGIDDGTTEMLSIVKKFKRDRRWINKLILFNINIKLLYPLGTDFKNAFPDVRRYHRRRLYRNQ